MLVAFAPAVKVPQQKRERERERKSIIAVKVVKLDCVWFQLLVSTKSHFPQPKMWYGCVCVFFFFQQQKGRKQGQSPWRSKIRQQTNTLIWFAVAIFLSSWESFFFKIKDCNKGYLRFSFWWGKAGKWKKCFLRKKLNKICFCCCCC